MDLTIGELERLAASNNRPVDYLNLASEYLRSNKQGEAKRAYTTALRLAPINQREETLDALPELGRDYDYRREEFVKSCSRTRFKHFTTLADEADTRGLRGLPTPAHISTYCRENANKRWSKRNTWRSGFCDVAARLDDAGVHFFERPRNIKIMSEPFVDLSGQILSDPLFTYDFSEMTYARHIRFSPIGCTKNGMELRELAQSNPNLATYLAGHLPQNNGTKYGKILLDEKTGLVYFEIGLPPLAPVFFQFNKTTCTMMHGWLQNLRQMFVR